MRRGSLVAPLLLILIGGLFLINNLRPDLPLLDVLAQYWPFLLIGWGALRLLEILVWWVRSKPLPGAGISGGEWVLVVFLTVFGSIVFQVHRGFPNWTRGHIGIRGVELFGETFDYPIEEKTQPCGKTPRVILENLRGNARVVGGDVQEVKVNGRKTVRAIRQTLADEANSKTPVEIAVQGDQVIVRTNQERVSDDVRASADLEITVPRGAAIEGRGHRYGDFDVVDVLGGVEINSDNAGVRLQNIGGSVRLNLRKSDIVRAVNIKDSIELKGGRGQDIELENVDGQVTISGSYSGEIQFRNLAKPVRFDSGQTDLYVEKLPGQLRMAIGDLTVSNVVGPLRLNSRSRDVQITDFTQSIEISLDRGDIELHPVKLPLAKITAETRSGNIELAVPVGAKFVMKGTTNRGEIENDFGTPLKVASEGRSTRIEGAVGQGPDLTLVTNRGSITVRKGSGNVESAQKTPPQPPVPPKPAEAPLQPERQ